MATPVRKPVQEDSDWETVSAPQESDWETVSSPAQTSPKPGFYGGMADYPMQRTAIKAAETLGRNVKGAVTSLWDAFAKPREGPEEQNLGPIGLASKRLIFDPASEMKRRSQEEWGQGRYSEAIGHRTAEFLPFLGPWAAGAAEEVGTQLGTGDYSGGFGTAIGHGLTLPIMKKGVQLTGAAIKAAPKVPAIAGDLANQLAERTQQSLTGADPKNTAPVSRSAPALVAEAPVAATKRGYTKKVQELIDKRNASVEQAVQASAAAPPEPLAPIVDSVVGPAISAAERVGNIPLAKSIEKFGTDFKTKNPANLSLPQLHDLRKELGNKTRIFQGTNQDEISLNDTKRDVVRAMSSTIDQRIPGYRDLTQRESGLITGKELLEEKARRNAGTGLFPSLRLYGGEGGGMGWGGVSFHTGLPLETAPKTLLIKALGKRVPLPEPRSAGPLSVPVNQAPVVPLGSPTRPSPFDPIWANPQSRRIIFSPFDRR